MFTIRSAPFLTLSCRLGCQNRLCFDLQQVCRQVQKVPLCTFQLQRPALPMLQLCSLRVSRGTRDEFSAYNSWSFLFELLSRLKTSDDKKITFRAESSVLLLQKHCFNIHWQASRHCLHQPEVSHILVSA